VRVWQFDRSQPQCGSALHFGIFARFPTQREIAVTAVEPDHGGSGLRKTAFRHDQQALIFHGEQFGMQGPNTSVFDELDGRLGNAFTKLNLDLGRAAHTYLLVH